MIGYRKRKKLGQRSMRVFDVNANLENERPSSPVVGYIVDPTFLILPSSPLLILHYPQLRLHLSPPLSLSFIH